MGSEKICTMWFDERARLETNRQWFCCFVLWKKHWEWIRIKMNCKRHSIRLNFDSLSFSFNVRKNLICFIYIYILFSFIDQAFCLLKRIFHPEKRANEPIPTFALSRWLPPFSPPKRTYSSKLTRNRRKDPVYSRAPLSRSRVVHLIFHPSRGNESLSLSLSEFSSTRENRRIISREKKREREKNPWRERSLFSK